MHSKNLGLMNKIEFRTGTSLLKRRRYRVMTCESRINRHWYRL